MDPPTSKMGTFLKPLDISLPIFAKRSYRTQATIIRSVIDIRVVPELETFKFIITGTEFGNSAIVEGESLRGFFIYLCTGLTAFPTSKNN